MPSALKIPSRLKAANPATPAARNSFLPEGGKPKPETRVDSLWRCGTVSGTQATARAAAANKAKYTSNTSTVGRAKYWANRPATSGPRPRPPVLTTVETTDARRGFTGPSMSMRAAVAVPVIRPADKPDKERPTKSHPTDVATMKTTVLSALSARAAPSTGLRPTWSEARPANTSTASTPAA